MRTKIQYELDEKPIRGEIFSPERLEQFAVYLAENTQTLNSKIKINLHKRIEENYQIFLQVYKTLINDLNNNHEIPPAGSWLIDNHYIIEDQVREIRKDLPKKYYHELPKISGGELKGYPRIYSMSLGLIAHSDSHLEIETLKRFVKSYQTATCLKSGEIWAIPITLRVVLLENLRRLIINIIGRHEIKISTTHLAENILQKKISLESFENDLNRIINGNNNSDYICLAQISKQLRDQNNEVYPAMAIINNYIYGRKLTIDEIIHHDHLQQAIDQVSIGNIVTSMRLLSSIDWRDFFEEVSVVEPVLHADPAGYYSQMDFNTRDRYRHVIEKIAKQTEVDELSIATKVIAFANESLKENSSDQEKAHIGYYLIGEGQNQLEEEFVYTPNIRERIQKFILGNPNLIYFGLFIILQALFIFCILFFSKSISKHNIGYLFIALSFIPVSDTAISLLNLIITKAIPPRILPKLEFKKTIPSSSKTFVVIPTIFSNQFSVTKLIEILEVHYLSNIDPNLYFAILSDFKDSNNQVEPEDQGIIDLADKLISELNNRYCKKNPQFYFFHRPRLWNEGESKWMGWERKRGKLEEFNQFLRMPSSSIFLKCASDKTWDHVLFAQIKYVITLDSDTKVPRECLKKLIGTIMHPMNAPQFNSDLKKVTRGYTILQPRISITPTSSTRSFFSKIYSGHTGIDPYTTAVSDIYQDLFAEGSFVGKGLYVVDAFKQCLDGEIKENTILSHDLFEGLFSRTALVTDIEFLDDYPSHYDAFVRRSHRWIRGDWQISKWIFSSNKKRFTIISRWKIFDNLRRSLVAPLLVASLYFSFITINQFPMAFWFLLFILYLPVAVQVTSDFFCRPFELNFINHLKNIFSELKIKLTQVTLSVIFLPHQAYTNLDAIIRTLYRLCISKKHLLEWTTAAETESMILSKNLPSLFIIIPTESFVLFTTLSLVLVKTPLSFLVATPFLLMWFFFPSISHHISKTKRKTKHLLDKDEISECRLLARRTWNFFETFVTENDNWLAPDNFQEDPKPVIAHRTSPTNMGVLLLSTAAAYDFGFLGSFELLDRLEKTQTTLDSLEKYKGHFYNWYDTTNLKPLYPIYISTVDSGNLAAYLITLKSFCLNLINCPFIEEQVLNGFHDTFTIIKEELNKINPRFLISPLVTRHREHNECHLILDNLLINLNIPKSITDWFLYSENIKINLSILSDLLMTLALEHGEKKFREITHWIHCAEKMLNQLFLKLNSFSPITSADLDILKHSVQGSEEFLEKIQSHFNELHPMKALPTVFQEGINLLLEFKNTISILPDGIERHFEVLLSKINYSRTFCLSYLDRIQSLAARYNFMALSFDFKFLYNQERKIFSIGYNLTESKMDNSYYDLLASEARLASFFAIAKSDVPLEHWFHLGRQMSSVGGNRALVSWSASMFEYLMPLLIMKNYDNTLLSETYVSVVAAQITYAKNFGLPWGVSESGYNARDLLQFYQYGPFGIPGLGLKYGLASDLVISPYSSILASMINSKEALENIKKLKEAKAYGKYGFYEAIDYTTDRLQKGHKNSIVKSFMVHHQGMVLISLDNVLHNNIMQTYFHSDSLVKAAELLLQEKIPQTIDLVPHHQESLPAINQNLDFTSGVQIYKQVNPPFPCSHILSNGSYTVMLTTTGSGFSQYQNLAISRWTEDSTLESKGNFIFFHDNTNNTSSSTTFQPMRDNEQSYETYFSEHKVEFFKYDPNITLHTEIIISPEDHVELRRITISNNSQIERNVDITSYMEPVLARAKDDNAHLTFSKLFLETEFIDSKSALLVHRRKRSNEDKERWGIHVVVTNAAEYSPTEYETDRMRFVGRGHTLSSPKVIVDNLTLSNTTGTVLDPVLSLRKCLTIPARSKVKICFSTGITESRDEALRIIDKYHDIHAFDREQDLSWTQTQSELRHLKIEIDDAHLFQELASVLIFSNPLMRPISENLKKNHKSQDGLWAFGISGDIPILTIKLKGERDLPIVKMLLRAHEYLRLKKIIFDLVIINYEDTSYRMSLHDEVNNQIRSIGITDWLNKTGGIFLLNSKTLSQDDQNMFLAFSKVVIDSLKGTLREQLQRLNYKLSSDSNLSDFRSALNINFSHKSSPVILPKLNFYNGLGGFNLAGNEYCIFLNKGQHTPAPWINVIANQNDFGFIISETGNSYTWSQNSRENRLTPWSNDPVNDAAGEAIYIRDEESFKTWSPTPWPIRNDQPYLITHGQGFSKFEYNNEGIEQELLYFVSLKDNIKIGRLKLKNTSLQKRKLSATYYLEWTLGTHRSYNMPYIVTNKLENKNILLAQNHFNKDFHAQIAFCSMSGAEFDYSCNRHDFLGRNHSYENPIGMQKTSLSKQLGAGMDPCAALRTFIEVESNEEKEIIFLLGQSTDSEKIIQLVETHLNPAYLSTVFAEVSDFWKKTTQVIQIKTPSPKFDLLINHWTLYQTLTCRMWARSALYQSGGAYGFRDQLQDSLGLLYTLPEISRAHILKCTEHQFVEGDVQHWWHPPSNKGVRTRFSDDLLWLPYVVHKYLLKTEDWSLLDETTNYLQAPLLSNQQEDLYLEPATSEISSSVYEHCIRAINRSFSTGVHGLPLMGAGDWNDGMNHVGIKGTGESVWVGWFFAKILKDFSAICLKRNDQEHATKYLTHSESLIKAIDKNAWDGQWYLRAFFDDGTPLGSSQNDECQIDSLTQSWSVLNDEGDKKRQTIAMESLSERLILKKEKLCTLFTPPFDSGISYPGYIKGYPPGIRENGGQYNHAAIWSSMALAMLNENELAFEILSFVNPINRTNSLSGLQLYKLEPYVLSADIYSGSIHAGRGGWSWYTGSSSLFYQAGIEYILGMQIEGVCLSFKPCLPKDWKQCEILYRWKKSSYFISIENSNSNSNCKITMELDGQKVNESKITLSDDGQEHRLIVFWE